MAIRSTLFTLLGLILIGGAVFWYVQYTASHQPTRLALSPEAKEYVRNLKLSQVELKADETYVKQLVVAIVGKISNAGARALRTVEIFCVFRDTYGQLVLRERMPIVTPRMSGLKPGETKSFRLAFDNIPESWNHQLPQLVIAGIEFQ